MSTLFAQLDKIPCPTCGKPMPQFPDDDWNDYSIVCKQCVEAWLKGAPMRWGEFAPRGGAGKMGTYVHDRYLRDLVDKSQ